jgi:hypothetical protein
MRYATPQGPVSFILTITERPFLGFVTVKAVPRGHVRAAAVLPFELNSSPLAVRFPECLSGNFSLKTLDESRHGLPNMLLSGTSFNFAIWKSESNQTHVSGRTLRNMSSRESLGPRNCQTVLHTYELSPIPQRLLT